MFGISQESCKVAFEFIVVLEPFPEPTPAAHRELKFCSQVNLTRFLHMKDQICRVFVVKVVELSAHVC